MPLPHCLAPSITPARRALAPRARTDGEPDTRNDGHSRHGSVRRAPLQGNRIFANRGDHRP